ncbi:MAG: hypothetical protein ABFS45_17605 [Pseudomonadota bacterium]
MSQIEVYSTDKCPWRTAPQNFTTVSPSGGFDELSKLNLPDKLNQAHFTITKRGIYP